MPSNTRSRSSGKAARRRGPSFGPLARLALLAWLLRCLVIEPFYIPSASMLPTMWIGDYLFVAKWPYGYSRYSLLWNLPPFRGRLLSRLPARGDIAVFKPTGREDTSWVKRVIGLPGDTIAMHDGTLILNGSPVPKVRVADAVVPVTPNSPCRRVAVWSDADVIGPSSDGRCHYRTYRETLPGGRSYLVLDQSDASVADQFGPVTVPAGTVFMMGDNRDDSEDSRFSVAVGGAGFVPVDHLVGRATMTFWSTDGSASYGRPWTWFTALRASRIGVMF